MMVNIIILKLATTAAALLPEVTKGWCFCWNQTRGIQAVKVSLKNYVSYNAINHDRLKY
jgi:hypothetical protein